MKVEFSLQFFEECLKIKFHEIPSTGIRVVSYGRTDMTKLIVAFLKFVNAPKNCSFSRCFVQFSTLAFRREGKASAECVREEGAENDNWS